MRVLHFCGSFSPLTQTFIYDQIVELERQAGDQYVVTLARKDEIARPFPKVHFAKPPAWWNAVRIWNRARGRSWGAPLWLSTSAAWQKRLMRAIRAVSPDGLHAHFGREGILLSPLACQLGLPLITSFYGYDASQLLEDPTWRALLQRHITQAAGTISLSERMRDRLIAIGAPADRAHIVHLGKRLEDYPFLPPKRVRRFLSVGRMTEKKGHLDTLRAYSYAAGEFPDTHLDIVGEGPLLTAVERFVRTRGLSGNVTLHGGLPHERVRQMLGTADAFLLCSKTAADGDAEGTPTVLLEAQAAGLPCISTFHAGIPEAVPKANHQLLVPEGDVEGITDRLRWLIGATPSDLLRIAELGRAHVHSEYNLLSETRKLRSVYQHVIPYHPPTQAMLHA